MVPIRCDVHKWMASFVGVLSHAFFATSNDKGEFSIEGLPDGEYQVEAWHEKLGTKSGTAKVADGKGTIDFSFAK